MDGKDLIEVPMIRVEHVVRIDEMDDCCTWRETRVCEGLMRDGEVKERFGALRKSEDGAMWGKGYSGRREV
jgi:hypothetical protein